MIPTHREAPWRDWEVQISLVSGPGAANVAQRVEFAPGRPARGMKGRHERSDRLEPILRLFRARWSDSFVAQSRRLVIYGLKTS